MVQKKKKTVTVEAVVLDEEKLLKVLGNWKVTPSYFSPD